MLQQMLLDEEPPLRLEDVFALPQPWEHGGLLLLGCPVTKHEHGNITEVVQAVVEGRLYLRPDKCLPRRLENLVLLSAGEELVQPLLVRHDAVLKNFWVAEKGHLRPVNRSGWFYSSLDEMSSRHTKQPTSVVV